MLLRAAIGVESRIVPWHVTIVSAFVFTSISIGALSSDDVVKYSFIDLSSRITSLFSWLSSSSLRALLIHSHGIIRLICQIGCVISAISQCLSVSNAVYWLMSQSSRDQLVRRHSMLGIIRVISGFSGFCLSDSTFSHFGCCIIVSVWDFIIPCSNTIFRLCSIFTAFCRPSCIVAHSMKQVGSNSR